MTRFARVGEVRVRGLLVRGPSHAHRPQWSNINGRYNDTSFDGGSLLAAPSILRHGRLGQWRSPLSHSRCALEIVLHYRLARPVIKRVKVGIYITAFTVLNKFSLQSGRRTGENGRTERYALGCSAPNISCCALDARALRWRKSHNIKVITDLFGALSYATTAKLLLVAMSCHNQVSPQIPHSTG